MSVRQRSVATAGGVLACHSPRPDGAIRSPPKGYDDMKGPARRFRDRIGQPATVIGPEARVEGRITGRGHVLVAGTVEGDAEVEGAVTLAEGGRWEGSVKADDVILAGSFSGDLEARDGLEIAARARVEGRIVAGRLAMAEGSVVDAEIRVTGGGEITRFEEKRKGKD